MRNSRFSGQRLTYSISMDSRCTLKSEKSKTCCVRFYEIVYAPLSTIVIENIKVWTKEIEISNSDCQQTNIYIDNDNVM